MDLSVKLLLYNMCYGWKLVNNMNSVFSKQYVLVWDSCMFDCHDNLASNKKHAFNPRSAL